MEAASHSADVIGVCAYTMKVGIRIFFVLDVASDSIKLNDIED